MSAMLSAMISDCGGLPLSASVAICLLCILTYQLLSQLSAHNKLLYYYGGPWAVSHAPPYVIYYPRIVQGTPGLKELGLDPKQFGLHSLRGGGASAAANAGVPDRWFKRHGRWISENAKDGYIKGVGLLLLLPHDPQFIY